MTATLTTSIRDLAEALEQREQQLIQREHDIARAAESLSQSAAVQSAWHGGQQHERGRVVAMIDLQLEQLGSAGLNALSLRALRARILESQAQEVAA
jgi:hypothetical protein